MRIFIAIGLSLGLWSTCLAGDEARFPYKTTCASDDVYVRSGPGQNYYPTDKLKRGQEVEVYRHDPGGWCAVRPVEGSFTWILGRYLKPTEDHLAVVTDEGVSARVGSRFSDIRDVVQVRLHKGETVEVIEGPANGSGWGQNVWFKIAPPAGEFRWVSSKYLSSEYPREGTRKTPPPERPDGRPDFLPDADGDARHGQPAIPAEAMREPGRHESDGDAYRARSTRSRSLTPEEFQAEVDRIEFELSVMVIEDPAAWWFDSLRERTNYLLDNAQTAVERGRTRLLATKIARFDDIKQRQEAVLAMRTDVDRDSRLLGKLRPQNADEGRVAARVQTDGRYDGVGRLTQVVSPKRGAPRYALVDRSSGDVQCYVTPAPGVQLQNYVDREVGINGTRGYMPEQRTSHIMARHVTPLDGSLLR